MNSSVVYQCVTFLSFKNIPNQPNYFFKDSRDNPSFLLVLIIRTETFFKNMKLYFFTIILKKLHLHVPFENSSFTIVSFREYLNVKY